MTVAVLWYALRTHYVTLHCVKPRHTHTLTHSLLCQSWQSAKIEMPVLYYVTPIFLLWQMVPIIVAAGAITNIQKHHHFSLLFVDQKEVQK